MSFGSNEILILAGVIVVVIGLRTKPVPVKVPVKKSNGSK